MSLTPRPYSTGTSARKRRSCWARRAASSAVNGAAVKPSSVGGRGVHRSRAVAQRRERGARRLRRRGAAVLLVAVGEDLEVAGRLGGRLGAARRQVVLGASAGVVEQLAQARLVGVEQVLLDGLVRAAGVELAVLEPLDGDRRVGARAREAGGGAELAQQQPLARRGRVAALDGRQRRRERPAQDRRAGRAAGGGEPHGVGAPRRRRGRAQRPADRGVGRRDRPRGSRPELASVGRPRPRHVARRRRLRADDQLGLGVEQRVAYRRGVTPRRRRGRRGGSQRRRPAPRARARGAPGEGSSGR